MKLNNKKILVIGAGAWGSSISNLLANNKHQVFLNSNEPEVVTEINKKHSNSKYLPNIALNKSIKAVSHLESDVDFVFIVVPSISFRIVLKEIAKTKFKKNTAFVICSKGLESESLKLLSDVFEDVLKSKNYAVLSGPNFAAEVSLKMPTVTTIASENKALADKVIKVLDNDYFKAFYSADPRCAEICGLVKNIIAISCGMAEGLNLGVNTKSAAVMKGISEIEALCKKLKTGFNIVNPAGFGDIFLTCSSAKSRNNSLGRLLAEGKQMDKNTTYEGAVAAKLVVALSKKLKLHLDLCEAVNEIISHKFSQKEIEQKLISAILK